VTRKGQPVPLATELRVLPAVDIDFPIGIPGLRGVRKFKLEPLGADVRENALNPFGKLIALEPVLLSDGSYAEALRLIVAAPGLLWPNYKVEIDESTLELLEIESPEDAAALVVITLKETLALSTANLFAPIVLNTKKYIGAQILPQKHTEDLIAAIHTPLPQF
jgi:flagellar assembly factor FliW